MRWDGAKLTFPRRKCIKIGWEWVSVLVNVGIYQCDVMILWNIGATMGSKKHDVAFDEKVIFEHDVKKLTHHTLQWNLPQCEITCRWTKCYPWGIRNIRVNSNILGHPLYMRTYFVLLCLYDAHTKENNTRWCKSIHQKYEAFTNVDAKRWGAAEVRSETARTCVEYATLTVYVCGVATRGSSSVTVVEPVYVVAALWVRLPWYSSLPNYQAYTGEIFLTVLHADLSLEFSAEDGFQLFFGLSGTLHT